MASVSVIARGLFITMICHAPAGAQDVYRFDPVHTQILFFVGHLGFSHSQGEFLEFTGEFTFDEQDFTSTRVTLTIDAGSLDMDDESWNEQLKGRRYLDVSRFPDIRFAGTGVEPTGDRTATVSGDLTLHGVTRPVAISMRFNRAGTHPLSGRYVAGFSGRTVIRRSDFGIDSDLKWVGDEVEIRLEIEGVLERKTIDSQQ